MECEDHQRVLLAACDLEREMHANRIPSFEAEIKRRLIKARCKINSTRRRYSKQVRTLP